MEEKKCTKRTEKLTFKWVTIASRCTPNNLNDMPWNTCNCHASRHNWGNFFEDYCQVVIKRKGKTGERPDICPIKFQMFDRKGNLFLSFFQSAIPTLDCFGQQPDHVQKFSLCPSRTCLSYWCFTSLELVLNQSHTHKSNSTFWKL